MSQRRMTGGGAFLAVLVFCTIDTSVLADRPTQSASTRPIIADRDTPAGAMAVFDRAIENRDLSTAADCYNLPEGGAYMLAARQIANAKLDHALEKRFGKTEAKKALADARIPVITLSVKYLPDDWISPVHLPNLALGGSSWAGATPVPTMQRGPDGIWRMGSISSTHPLPPALVAAMKAKAMETTAEYDPVIAGIQTGKYATIDDVMNALFPPGSPQRQEWAMRKQMEQQQEEANQQFLATQFDVSTLDGAVDDYMQSVIKRDAAGMVKFYYVNAPTNDRFARAYAERILTAGALDQALVDHLPNSGHDDLAVDFGLMPDLPKGMTLSEQGDRGIGSRAGPDQKSIWFRKVDGLWKQDITPQPPMTPGEAAQLTEQDNATVQRIIANMIAGKYRSVPEVRDALGEAMLNATPDPMFVMGDMRVSEEPLPAMPRNPTAVGIAPTTRTSPAGAMNILIRAIETSDAATVADSLYMPQDKDGSCHQAAARDLIAGYRLLLAAEARFGADGAAGLLLVRLSAAVGAGTVHRW